MIFKYLIILLFIFILYNLGAGLVFMLKDKGRSNKTVKSLTWRIGISIFAFILLLIAQALGWIQPHEILPPRP